MGLIIATTGADLMSGQHENVISDYDGTVTLAPISNLIPDPGFLQWKAKDGTLKYWDMGEPPRPTHWMVFGKDRNNVKDYGRQISGPIGLDKEFYEIRDALVPGGGPLNTKDTVDIAKPLKPKVTTFQVSTQSGFPAGYYCIAYGWAISAKFQKFMDGNKKLTGPGPRSDAFELNQGDTFYVRLPADPPEGASGIVYYLTPPKSSEVAALSAPMFIQDRVGINSKSGIHKFTGPLDIRYKDNGRNNSKVGGKKDMADIRHGKEKSKQGTNKTLYSSRVRTGYKVVTPLGSSVSKIASEDVVIDEFGATMTTFQPEEFDENVIGWIPEVYATDEESGHVTKFIIAKTVVGGKGRGKHKATNFPYLPIEEVATLYGTDPQAWPESSGTSLIEDADLEDYYFAMEEAVDLSDETIYTVGNDDEEDTDDMSPYDDYMTSETTPTDSSLYGSSMDETGIEPPTEAPEPTVYETNNSGLKPGQHWFKTALFVDEEEGPVSEPTMKNLTGAGGTTQDGLRIYRPKWHNKLINHDLGSRGPDGKPTDWEFLDVKPDYLPEKKGVIQLEDSGAPKSDADFFVTPPAEISATFDRYTATMKFHYELFKRGAFEVWVYEYGLDANENEIDKNKKTRLGRYTKPTKGDTKDKTVEKSWRMSQREEDAATPTLFKLDADTTHVRFRVKGVATARTGNREHKTRVADFAMYEGWSLPRTIDIDLEGAQKSPVKPPPSKNVKDSEHNKFSRPHGGYCITRIDPKDGPWDKDYELIDYTIFELGESGNWTHAIDATNTMIQDIIKEAGMVSEYGVRMEGSSGGGSNRVNYMKQIFNAQTKLTVSWDMFIDTFNENDVRLGAIRDTQNRVLALVTLTKSGQVILQHNTANGLSAPVVAMEGLDDGVIVHFKLSLDISSGKVTLFFGNDEDDIEEVARITGIDFSQFTYAMEALLGPSIPGFSVNSNASFKLIYGKVEITSLGDFRNSTRERGNYIEYYGPRGTPRNATYGPTGLRVPVKQQTEYTLAVNTWYHDMSKHSYVFGFRAMSKNHKVLKTYNPLAELGGNQHRWIREHKTFKTPEGTAYIEFHANRLGQGLLKLHGLQLEEGNIPTKFSMDMVRKGWFSVYFNNAQDQVLDDDPLAELGVVKQLRNIMVSATDNKHVSHQVRYRAGDTFAELDASPFIYDYAKLNMRKNITEVRVDLSSRKNDDTPEVRYIELDIERPYAQLLREDGTEYRGGTNVYEIQTPSSPPNVEVTELASGAKHFDEWGYEKSKTIKFKLRVFRRSTAEEIMGAYEHTLEWEGKRYSLLTEEPIVFTAIVGSRVYFNDDREYFQVEEADIEAHIISEERLI